MEDLILNYYERELTFIREMGAEFARKYPKIAGRLLLEPDKCEDPHTERLIEAFAFISGRIHKKINDDFPEISESLLNILYPHYVNPIPSMSVVRFDPLKQSIPPSGYLIDKKASLYSKPVNGVPCRFQTAYPVTIWPFEVGSASLQDPKRLVKNGQQTIAIQLKTFNALGFSAIAPQQVRFFLNGPMQHVFHLYELLMNNVCQVECEWTGSGRTQVVQLPAGSVTAVGFGEDEQMIPYPERSFPGYLPLFEYFCFPEKFLFFDLSGLQMLKKTDAAESITITIYLDRVAKSNLVVNKDTFVLNATPVVNLFSRIAEPIRVEHHKTEYQVVSDVRRPEATEIFSIDRVASSATGAAGGIREFKPFYSLRHHLEDEDSRNKGAFWQQHRILSGKKGDRGTEVLVSFADWNYVPVTPEAETLTLHVTCSNRDLPARLPFGDSAGDFDMEIAAPVAGVVCVIKPTASRRPSLDGGLQWRLISHLSLNYLSLVQGGEEPLKEMLKLYDFDDSPATRQQISGIVSVVSTYATRRIGQSIARGIQTTITFDEDRFVGTGLYLFACVLEKFLGQYVSVNSFSQLIVKTIQRKEVLKKWPPRNGNRILL